MKGSLPEPVRSLDALVCETLKARPEAGTEVLTSYMAEVSDPVSVKVLIENICADADLADHCFRNSLTHPLGFDKFLLLATDSYDLRLHVWWPDELPAQDDIHDHRFSLYSGIITGELQVSTHEICDGGNLMRHFEEIHGGEGHTYEYRVHDCVGVRETSRLSLSRGSSYYLRSGVLHQVTVLRGKVAATLFIRVVEPLTTSFILRGAGEPDPIANMRENLGVGEAERRIRAFLDVLA